MGLIGAPWAMETWQLALVALAASVFVRFVPRFLPSRMGTHVSVAFDILYVSGIPRLLLPGDLEAKTCATAVHLLRVVGGTAAG